MKLDAIATVSLRCGELAKHLRHNALNAIVCMLML